jgi:hypothetical protein
VIRRSLKALLVLPPTKIPFERRPSIESAVESGFVIESRPLAEIS